MGSDRSATDTKLSLATIAVHGGERADEQPFGAVVSPVFHSATFAFENFQEMRRYAQGELPEAYFYSRYANPTVAEAERKVAELEGAESCVVTASGSAATFCALATLAGYPLYSSHAASPGNSSKRPVFRRRLYVLRWALRRPTI
ncbi:MAG TPA: hypothetical protein DHU55_00220 [Blastocatellia bacterium]|jgi:cystathionine beta-lyase/cystathionine gamma-synthase|nr:hypothetical protein [Blastocatellia bacterium]HAF21881.1 hypothetical protein [Blastocatellia bacterium]HCX28194.1 hypothetical protein [Blastocatellia bacterium]